MDANPQLLRRTHSPFVAAAAAAAASSTLAVETHTHQHTHHQHHHDHAHAVGQAQPHLSPLLGQGLRPTGRSSPLLAGDLGSNGGKQLRKAMPIDCLIRPSRSILITTTRGTRDTITAQRLVKLTDFTLVRMRDMSISIITIILRTRTSTSTSTSTQGNRCLNNFRR
ncbi:hypothetical protein BGZ72_006875 [Mortierella alpina]|nr:hypothetical protein BGZ72_006875 [Mortierella alpina]